MSEITPSRKTGRARGYIADYRPQKKTLELIYDAQRVLKEYRPYWPLALRQIYYRLAGAHGYPKDEAFYERLGNHLGNARRARMIPFDAFRDDGAVTRNFRHYDDEEAFKRHIRHLSESYTRNKLAEQDIHIEVWCEAAGMLLQLADVAEDYSVQVFSCSGFDSVTAKKDLSDRICDIGKPAVILHLGDHDPSGMSVYEAIAEDVSAFVEADRPWPGITVTFKRVALTAEQVREYELPTAPPKATDSRSAKWKGATCQLEAMPPDIIAGLLREAIEAEISPAQYAVDCQQEEIDRLNIAKALPKPGAAE